MTATCVVCGRELTWWGPGRGRRPKYCRGQGCRSLRHNAWASGVEPVEVVRRALARAEAALLRQSLRLVDKEAKVKALRLKLSVVEGAQHG